MAAHLYWRLNVSANNGDAFLDLAELGLYVAGGASSAATGGTASASSTYSGSAASNAFDGNISTNWAANNVSTGWLKYQFASAVDIAVYSIGARNDSFGPNQSPKAWTLEWSDDDSAWTVVDTVALQKSWGQGETRYYMVGANAGTGTPQGAKLNAVRPAVETTIASWRAVHLGKAPATAARKVSGTVKVAGVATGGLLVRAYAKATGELIGQATSAGDGSYSINCGNSWVDVYVVAFNPTTYQMLAFDQVGPA